VTNRGVVQEPKSRDSVRAIAMPGTLVSALRSHQMASRFKDADNLVFSTEKATPLDGHNFVRRVFEPALRRAVLRLGRRAPRGGALRRRAASVCKQRDG
jgi:hypothetical protein